MNTQGVAEKEREQSVICKKYGVTFHLPEEKPMTYWARSENLYHYRAMFGNHDIEVGGGNTLFVYDGEENRMHALPGPIKANFSDFAVEITGYMLPMKIAEVGRKFNLPYVNGCATRQIFPPERLGDPTVQLLRIPAFSAEQAHHIHSTVRVVHIVEGSGRAIIGMDGCNEAVHLRAGMSMVLEPMCPHHFETEGEHLVCLPIHVFSSVGSLE